MIEVGAQHGQVRLALITNCFFIGFCKRRNIFCLTRFRQSARHGTALTSAVGTHNSIDKQADAPIKLPHECVVAAIVS